MEEKELNIFIEKLDDAKPGHHLSLELNLGIEGDTERKIYSFESLKLRDYDIAERKFSIGKLHFWTKSHSDDSCCWLTSFALNLSCGHGRRWLGFPDR